MLWNMHKKIFEDIIEEEHAQNAVIQEACKNGYNVNYVVVETDISKIAFPEGSVVESHDAGMYKNEDEDAYCMLSKMQKGAYEEFTEFNTVAEVFVEIKAEQAKKEAKQAKKEANKKSAMAKKSRQRPQINRCWELLVLY